MILFWLCAAVLSALLAGLLLRSAQRALARPASPDPALALYRRQLAEVDALAARRLLPSGEREAARSEAGRRLLSASAVVEPEGRAAPTWAAPAVAVLAPVLGAALYLAVGAPGFPDRAYQQRLAEWRAAPERLGPAEAAAVLNAITRERPTDAEAQTQLARARLASGDAFGAARAAEAAARLDPDAAARWTGLAEVLLELDPPQTAEARRALDRAEALTPGQAEVRYWRARAAFAEGELETGRRLWRTLLEDLPASDPRRAGLEAELAAATTPSGQVDAAIAAMVDSLAARLKAEPLDSEGWTRLVRAYAVLGREAELQMALAEARRLFRGRPEVLSALDQAVAAGRSRPALRAGP